MFNQSISLRFIIVFSILAIVSAVNAQTGPAGVGSSSNNILWLDASNLSLNDSDPVPTWSDSSGNSNNATQASSSARPTFKTNQINGLPVVEFDGSNDFLELGTNITTQDLTAFIIHYRNSATVNTYTGHFMTEKYGFYTSTNKVRMIFANKKNRLPISKSDNQFSIFSLESVDDAVDSIILRNGTSRQDWAVVGGFLSNTRSVVGARVNPNNQSIDFFSMGPIAEIILYNERLNSANRKIIGNYLAGKYNLTPEESLFAHGSIHGNQIIGIGQESDGSNTSAQGRGRLSISNPSGLSNGDYLLVGHNDAGFATNTSVPGTLIEKWDQVWRADETGNVGTVDLEFFLGANGFASPTNYVIVIESADGNFTNGGTSIIKGGSYNAGNNSMIFTGVDIPDDAYFTLAEKSTTITAVASNDWGNVATWSCSCIPDSTDFVTIPNTFTVTVESDYKVNELTIETGGTLDFSGSSTLSLYGDLIIDGTVSAGNGTIAAMRLSDAQNFENNTLTNVEFYDLYVENNSGLFLTSGGWSISNSLQVVTGGMDVTSADSIVLISDASKTMEIRESMDNAFTGDFIVQRYISTRNAGYANMSSPIEDATIADWDDDLYLSGVNGNNGNATLSGGGIFYSVYTYYPLFGQNGALQATTEPLNPGQGYEVYLADNLSTFNAKTIDYIGTPKTGKPDPYLLSSKGWNLYGNPFQSHIAYDSVDKDIFLPTSYYIYNTDNGSYDFITGNGKPLIAPGQGFWFNTNAAGKLLEIEEEDKVSSNLSSFVRKIQKEQYFNLNISSDQNLFKHKLRISVDPLAIDEKDDIDALHLPSPVELAPAITAKAINSDEELIFNAISPFEESHVIPVSVKTGVAGSYQIDAENIDALYKNYSCIYLKDKELDKSIDLLVEPVYSFESSVGKSDRFELILSNNFTSCDNLLKEGMLVQTLDNSISLRNMFDEVYIDYSFSDELRNVEVYLYNMNGQEVMSSINFTASGAGSFKLHNTENLNGIYLIQIKSQEEIINKTIKL